MCSSGPSRWTAFRCSPPPTSAWRCVPITPRAPRRCSSPPTWRCTRPSATASPRGVSHQPGPLVASQGHPAGRAAAGDGGGELALYYQPALDLRSGQITKVEALVRWHHRDHGLMLPVEFIETAEASGMIHPLTRWIIAEASRGANRMHDSGLDLRVAANLSVRNLQDPDLVSFFELLSRTDSFHAERLELEITETELMNDAVQAFEVLDRLRSIGLSVAVDDFGVGHSSLAYLKHLPLSHLKIDRGFVTTITSDPGDAAIVRSTIELAHNLGLTVTAEGAGDLETLMLLKDMGCDLVQGFFISEAVPFEQLAPLVDEVNEKVPEILRTGRLPEDTPPGVLVGNRVNPDREPSEAPIRAEPLPEGTGRALTAVANRALGHNDETIDLTTGSPASDDPRRAAMPTRESPPVPERTDRPDPARPGTTNGSPPPP
ncbi:MAG: EAL domain-containing protein [Microthrixaceae bacterium]